jgi:hypothetical protein
MSWRERDQTLRGLAFMAARDLARWGPVWENAPRPSTRETIARYANLARRILRRTGGVIVVSAPKSGRTWLRYMLDELGIHIQYTHANRTAERPADMRGRLIHLHRDPRDTITSVWHQRTSRRGSYAGTFTDLLRDPRLGLDATTRFNLFWGEHVAETGGLVTSYEALKQDTAAELMRIAQFAAAGTIDRARIVQAVEAGAFARMRELEESRKGAVLYGYALAPRDFANPDSYKTRKGTVGDWRNAFSPDDARWAENLLGSYGYLERMRTAQRSTQEN